MQTILGAGGVIGKELAKDLIGYSSKIRLASRTPDAINDNDELIAADLTNAEQVMKAVAGSEIVYLVAGLPYKLKIWQQQWPVIMQNVIAACKHYKSKLVFFDNVYLYDKNSLGNMTEESPVNPPSKKGKIRAEIANMLMDEVHSGNLTAMIVRSADFYGPLSAHSVIMDTVFNNLKKGKRAGWLVNARLIHSSTYVPDAAKATALLGNTNDAFNQVWHLPTSSQKITGEQWIEHFSKEMNIPYKYETYSPGLLRIAGIFNPILREVHEMLYQNDRDYFFNSEKFINRFPDFKTTSYEEGIKETVMAGVM